MDEWNTPAAVEWLEKEAEKGEPIRTSWADYRPNCPCDNCERHRQGLMDVDINSAYLGCR